MSGIVIMFSGIGLKTQVVLALLFKINARQLHHEWHLECLQSTYSGAPNSPKYIDIVQR